MCPIGFRVLAFEVWGLRVLGLGCWGLGFMGLHEDSVLSLSNGVVSKGQDFVQGVWFRGGSALCIADPEG